MRPSLDIKLIVAWLHSLSSKLHFMSSGYSTRQILAMCRQISYSYTIHTIKQDPAV